MAIRYLASPLVSKDDLKVLADASLAASKIRADPVMARRVVDTVLLALDRHRFPWVSDDREPTEAERHLAIISTTALMASEKIKTNRRNESKDQQEKALADFFC